MKKVIVFIILFSSLKPLSGQEYFNRKWERCSPESACYSVNPDKSGGNSHTVRFKENARFSKDYAVYKTDDFKTGEFTRFNKKGDTLMHMFYRDGKLNGRMRVWKDKGHLYRVANFIDDKENGITEYLFPNGQLSARYEFENGKIVISEFWNEDGSVLNDPGKANIKPKFMGKDFNSFSGWVASRLVFPNELRGLGIRGTVMVAFKITEKGYVRDVRALKSPHYLLAAEAVRVVENSPAWTPGIAHNQVAEITYIIPVIF